MRIRTKVIVVLSRMSDHATSSEGELGSVCFVLGWCLLYCLVFLHVFLNLDQFVPVSYTHLTLPTKRIV